ncbi:MAG: homoserine dehydrogenase [Spirochaetes bacterium]|nr:homoserine dehydrogenase [Spirochaetota bacterium]
MKIRCGLIGFGTVGSGVYTLLQKHKDDIYKKTGITIELVKICDVRDIASRVTVPVTNRWEDITTDPDIDTVIELIGGIEPAKSIILSALKAGKNVVTANKKLLAESGDDIFTVAQTAKGALAFEAAIGGGIPCVAALRNGLVGNTIQSVVGILNGTTNYILTRMAEDGMSFSQALKLAQEKGYAEADPTFDIEGFDAAHKIALLSMLAYNVRVAMQHIYIEGITKITELDIKYAHEMGYTIKLLGVSHMVDSKLDIRLQPVMIPFTHPLASVRNEFNAIMYYGDMTGAVTLYGKGAGSHPTASAVVSDIVSIAQKQNGIKDTVYIAGDAIYLTPDERMLKFYVRLHTEDRAGILSKISGVFGSHDISIASVIQKEVNAPYVPLVITTHKAKEASMRKAKQEIEQFPFVNGQVMILPIEDFENKDE